MTIGKICKVDLPKIYERFDIHCTNDYFKHLKVKNGVEWRVRLHSLTVNGLTWEWLHGSTCQWLHGNGLTWQWLAYGAHNNLY